MPEFEPFKMVELPALVASLAVPLSNVSARSRHSKIWTRWTPLAPDWICLLRSAEPVIVSHFSPVFSQLNSFVMMQARPVQ